MLASKLINTETLQIGRCLCQFEGSIYLLPSVFFSGVSPVSSRLTLCRDLKFIYRYTNHFIDSPSFTVHLRFI